MADLFGMHFPQGSADDRKVLCGNAHGSPIYGSPSGYDAIPGQMLFANIRIP